MQVIEAIQAGLEEIRQAADPLERCKQSHRLITALETATREAAIIRRDAMNDLIPPMTAMALAKELGISDRRIGQIRTGGVPSAPERAFFGPADTLITVAVAEKREADKHKPVVSIDDMQAYERLRMVVESLGFESTYETVKPPGMVRLNRDGLVLICGPRHSALIGQILEGDEKLGFARDENGWYLLDRATGTTHRSPEEQGRPGDVAYLGRLPRLDGKGHFLYIAGIHAAGSAGAVHYLAHNLADLYAEVKTRPFSTLISCEYDPDTREVVSSRRVTPIYKG